MKTPDLSSKFIEPCNFFFHAELGGGGGRKLRKFAEILHTALGLFPPAWRIANWHAKYLHGKHLPNFAGSLRALWQMFG